MGPWDLQQVAVAHKQDTKEATPAETAVSSSLVVDKGRRRGNARRNNHSRPPPVSSPFPCDVIHSPFHEQFPSNRDNIYQRISILLLSFS